jgi:hypothetical protein
LKRGAEDDIEKHFPFAPRSRSNLNCIRPDRPPTKETFINA